MARIPVARADARHRVDPGFVRDSNELLEARLGILRCIDGFDLRPAAPAIAFIEEPDFGFLDETGIVIEIVQSEIFQNHRQQSVCRSLREEGADYTLPYPWLAGPRRY